jgi:tetratricopeptide (TPR) repeat protein
MARRLGDPATLAHVLLSAFVPVADLSSDPAAFDEWRTARASLGRDLGDPALEFWEAVSSWAWTLMSGDVPAAKGTLDVVGRLGEELGQPSMRWVSMFIRGTQSLVGGQFEDAEALAHEAFELGSAAGLADAARVLHSQLFWIRYDQGRLAEVLDVFARGAGREGARSLTRAMLSLLLCELERPDEARPLFDALAANDFTGVGYPWLQTLMVLAKVCPALGQAEQAAFLCDCLSPHHALAPSLVTNNLEPVAHHLGLLTTTLGRYDEAQAHFEEAAQIAERMEAPAWLTRTRLEWARMLIRRAGPGDFEQVRLLAGAVLASAEELGMARVAAQARALVG